MSKSIIEKIYSENFNYNIYYSIYRQVNLTTRTFVLDSLYSIKSSLDARVSTSVVLLRKKTVVLVRKKK